MIIEDVMSTNLIVGYVPGSIKDALETLAKNNVSGMPILKKNTNNVVGVITRTDIFKNSDEDQIALVMNEDFHYIKKDQDISDAAKLLFENYYLKIEYTVYQLLIIKKILSVLLAQKI